MKRRDAVNIAFGLIFERTFNSEPIDEIIREGSVLARPES
jgi:hypothetical protein